MIDRILGITLLIFFGANLGLIHKLEKEENKNGNGNKKTKDKNTKSKNTKRENKRVQKTTKTSK